MDTTQMLWGVNSLLIVILGFMVRSWVGNINGKMASKQDKAVCKERYPNLKADVTTLFSHKHPVREGQDETGGVIIP